jgi:pyruvate-ferredoxin/flavodoxin oxidoreductase
MTLVEPRLRTVQHASVDGNEAVARVAHRLSEVVAIYPITPASAMGELADAWSAAGRRNLWGIVPEVVEMQSEAGAAGVLHGAVMRGALATTFTASQGLLLMLPNMFKIAGELSPAVIHVAARTVATHALSIFGDQSDVMAVRAAGWAMLCSSSVQEAQDLALVSHAATLTTRVPFLHFFDGFRTSHEIDRIEALDDADLAAMIDEDAVRAHRARGLTPDRPVLRGSAQNPDVFFQAREASNPFHLAVPDAVQAAMDGLGERTGRRYHLVDYEGAPDAERVIVLMGSGAGAAAEAVEAMNADGARVGLLTVRLFRPFPGRRARRGPAADRPRDRGAGPDEGTGRPRRAPVPRRRDRDRRAGDGRDGAGRRGRPARASHRDRRSLRPVLEGVHAGDGPRRLRRAVGPGAEAPLHRGHRR